jgi:hypothetical protein
MSRVRGRRSKADVDGVLTPIEWAVISLELDRLNLAMNWSAMTDHEKIREYCISLQVVVIQGHFTIGTKAAVCYFSKKQFDYL